MRSDGIIEIDEGVFGPELAADFFPADDRTGTIEEKHENLEGLLLDSDSGAVVVPGGVVRSVQSNPAQVPGLGLPQPASRQEVLDAFEESITAVRSVLPTFDDAAMSETRRLVVDGQEILAQPRGEFLRDIMLSHWYQHRGQFSV